eukprot:5929131-Karenia_brevis.AAC.1
MINIFGPEEAEEQTPNSVEDLEAMYAFSTPPRKMFGTRMWGSPLNESDSTGKLLQKVPAFPEGGERKESSKEEDR